jgi:hypothetical protein
MENEHNSMIFMCFIFETECVPFLKQRVDNIFGRSGGYAAFLAQF